MKRGEKLKRSSIILQTMLEDDKTDPSDYLNLLKRHPHIQSDPHHGDNDGGRSSNRMNRVPIAGVDGCWRCPDSCGNVNYPRRSSCNLCGRMRDAEGTKIVRDYVNRLVEVARGGEGREKERSGSSMIHPSSKASSSSTVSTHETPLLSVGTRAEIINMKFKTKLCKQWVDSGRCLREGQCDFAHGAIELRKINDNASGTGAAERDSLRLRFDLTAVANSIMSQVPYTSNTACVEPQYNAMNECVSVKVALYGHWALEFTSTSVRLLEEGVSSHMSKASRNAVLETMGSTIRISGHPGKFTLVDHQGRPLLGLSTSNWFKLLTPLPWKSIKKATTYNVNAPSYVYAPQTSSFTYPSTHFTPSHFGGGSIFSQNSSGPFNAYEHSTISSHASDPYSINEVSDRIMNLQIGENPPTTSTTRDILMMPLAQQQGHSGKNFHGMLLLDSVDEKHGESFTLDFLDSPVVTRSSSSEAELLLPRAA